MLGHPTWVMFRQEPILVTRRKLGRLAFRVEAYYARDCTTSACPCPTYGVWSHILEVGLSTGRSQDGGDDSIPAGRWNREHDSWGFGLSWRVNVLRPESGIWKGVLQTQRHLCTKKNWVLSKFTTLSCQFGRDPGACTLSEGGGASSESHSHLCPAV